MRFYRVHAKLIDEDLSTSNHMIFDFNNSSDAISFANDAHEANCDYNINVEVVDTEDTILVPQWRAN